MADARGDNKTHSPPSLDTRLALTPAEAARALGIGERLLWEATNRGDIPTVRINSRVLYPVDALRTWLRDQSTKELPR